MAGPAIRAFAYDAERNELTLTFGTGRAYIYSLVPPTLYAAFAAAPAKGRFHNEQLRDRYPFRKVRAQEVAVAILREALIASAEAEDDAPQAPEIGERQQP